jgi:hypothetical protein
VNSQDSLRCAYPRMRTSFALAIYVRNLTVPPQDPRARCAHDASCRIRDQSEKEKARRGNLWLDEGLWRLASYVLSRSRAGATARLYRRGGLQPAPDESIAARYGIGASADRGNGCLASRTSARSIKYRSRKPLQPGPSQLDEQHKDHFDAFCIRLLEVDQYISDVYDAFILPPGHGHFSWCRRITTLT